MGLFGNDTKLREEDRIYRIKIRERLLEIPGLFDSPSSSKIVDNGLCAPYFKVTKSTIEMDEKIDELSKSIASVKTEIPGSQKVYEGLIVEMFTYRNDESNVCKGKEFEQLCKNWEVDKAMCEAKIKIENLKKQKAELDPNDLYYNMKSKKIDDDIKSEADTIKRLLEVMFLNDKYLGVVKKSDIENTVNECANSTSKDFAKQVNLLRKKRVKNDLEKNRKEDQYKLYSNMLDDSDN
ncbi:MAG: hypothetical protein BHW12_02765 [Coprobacillus sp. 28_7]|nr:MAG: hypothetical protein BHW12_02765 [Coprobacillus sp. 28_7]